MAGVAFLCLALLSCPHPMELLLAAGLHELAHVAVALIFGWGAPSVSVNGGGLRLSWYGDHGIRQSVAVDLAGSLFGLLIAFLPFPLPSLRLYCFGLSLVNLLPVRGLDGGGILYKLLLLFMLPDGAYRVSSAVSVLAVMGLWAGCVAVQLKAGVNVTLLAVSVYLTVTALSDG